MNILVIHNYYQQAGGEDQVFLSEARMLESRGHRVTRLTENNDRVAELGKLALARATIWNGNAYRRILEAVRRERAQVVHFHNTFPLLSPSCYYAARKGGAAVVQTLHNYRLLCPAATLLRAGKPCEDCVGLTVPWHGVQHSCYRGSRTATAGVATMLAIHNMAGTWTKAVDAYIALTAFSRARFIAGGLPADRIYTKPNFTEPDPGMGSGGCYYLYAGRLSPEKGLVTLLQAWRSAPGFPLLRIAGDGPLRDPLRAEFADLANVEWLGRQPREAVLTAMRGARALILPSIWYENFPVTVVEAFATGLPVIASDAGTLPELVRSGVTGLIFRSSDAADLARQVATLESHSAVVESMRLAARAEFELSYREDKNYLLLMSIYRNALSRLAAEARS